MKKITLTEFWNSIFAMAIHCDTEEKANELLQAFDKLGKKWSNSISYLLNNLYSIRRQSTCYAINDGYCGYVWYEEDDDTIYKFYTVYEFEDVDLEN